MKIKTIFLDLDDVLNRFTMYALQHVGCAVDAYDDSIYEPEWGWDIVKAANALPAIAGPVWQGTFTAEKFWSYIGREVWANAPASDECYLLLGMCENLVGYEDICILSSPTLDPECLAGKLEWIHRYMPKYLHRQYLIGPKKWMCARPDALLIDDSYDNVFSFRNAGGQALLVPRPWNILHESNAMKHLRWSFEIIKRSQ